MPTARLSVIPRDIAKRPVATNGERLNMIRLVWILGMGIGVLASVATFFGTEPGSAPQQAVVGVWSLYYLILPYTTCRAIERAIRG